MRTFIDQIAKQISVWLFGLDGPTTTEEEVVAIDPQRIDLWFVPDPDRTRRCPGLLRRMTEQASMLEFFSRPPSVDQVRGCIRKQLTWEHELHLRGEQHKPQLWLVSSGKPVGVIEKLGFTAREGWPAGVYALPPGWRVFLVAVAELPGGRDTLMLRLMGAGEVFRAAVRELEALPAQALERGVETLLGRLHVELRDKMTKHSLTKEEADFLSGTEHLFEQLMRRTRQEGRAEGVDIGRAEGVNLGRREGSAEARAEFTSALRNKLLSLYARRFGECPAPVSEVLESTTDVSVLLRWLEVVAIQSEEDIARELKASSSAR